MRLKKQNGYMLWFYLGAGFLSGIFFENLAAKNQGTAVQLFQTYFLKQYSETKMIAEDFLWYVIKIRMVPLMMFCLSICLKWRKLVAAAYMIWTGFLGGILTVVAVMQLGIKGILICMSGFLPHILFYGIAYGIMLVYLYSYPQTKWNGKKTITMILMFFLGILTETYLNPYLLNFMIRLI